MGGPSSETKRRLGWWPARNEAPQVIKICMILLCLANQMAHLAANVQPPTSRYELKFQNELDNSTVIKHLAQQQVFKCQVRLAPLSQAAAMAAISASANTNNNQRRLKTTSSWLTNEAAEQKYSKLVQDLHNDPLSRMLLSSSSTEASSLQQQQQQQHKQLINVTYFSIDWLKDGHPVWSAFEGEPVAIVNVTLKTQRNLDKMARPVKSRVEIKNTLNGQQMKLTSRLRMGQLLWADSGQYKCVARVSFLQRPPEQQQQQQQQQSDGQTDSLIEYIEQSLESVGAHLIVMPLGSNSTNGINDGAAANNMNSHRPTGPLRTNNKETTAAATTTNPEQPTTTGYDNEVRHRKAETGRPQLQLDNTQDTDEPSLTPSERSQFANRLAGPTATTGSQPNPLFEDDEDLFRLDFSELINGHHNSHQQQQHQLATDDNISLQDQRVASNSGDTIDSNANDLLVNSQPIPRERQHEADLDWILDNGNDPAASQQSSAPVGDRGPLSSSFSSSSSQYQQSANRFGDKKIDDQGSSRATKAEPPESALGETHPSRRPTPSWDDRRHELGGAAAGALPFDHRHDHHASSSSSSSSPPSLYVGRLRPVEGNPPPTADPMAGTRSKLAKFVHKIVPEPSCYTGFGEHYRGNASISSDQRPCLNWLQVRAALSRTTNKPTATGESQSRTTLRLTSSVWHAFDGAPSHPDDHNHCRNPNNDQRGPWCFVAYSEELDGALVARPYLSASRQQWKTVTSKRRTVRVGPDSGQLFVVAQCQLASCSEYLWLYVVAPPLGLLVLLTCLISFMIRSIRKSHYNAIFSAAYQRHSDPLAKSSNGLLSRLMLTKKRLVIDQVESVSSKRQTLGCCGLGFSKRGLPFTSSSLSSPRKRKPAGRGKYLDEDIFEVVDDIDWSDGQPTTTTSQSMSPSESFRLHSTATTCDEQHSIKTPVSPGCRQLNNNNNNWHQHRSTLTHSKSINPVFGGGQVAALDLPLFHQSRQQSAAAIAPASNNIAHKMSKSRSQVGPMFATLRCHVRNAQQHHQQQRQLHEANSCQQRLVDSSKQQETTCDRASPSMTSNQSSLQAKTTTINDRSIATNVKNSSDGSNGVTEAYTLASELTQLDASSVTLAYDTQPIYEGKFSQVQMAYIKQRKDDLAQATGRIGAQVAVCSLKEQAALDESVFYATNLRLRNLNHLNILKLMGYVQLDNNLEMGDMSCNETSSTIRADVKSSLVYDMAHLIDLNDWLKEQCKDNNDLSLKQNLTCLAKQIALALDYLHDKDIIYKDLACRNCFLDVTRMLVKLASFNIEPEFEIGESCRSGGNDEDFSKRMSLKSMVRPKYLLDYYVIDSRPAECQLLPLSWISLESILFNKFNKHTDIWSYGCLLYELFSLGEVAYFGYSSKQVIDSVRSNLMPPQPLLCPNGIYRLMCKCLSDIPTLRPDIKHVYEQLNLYSGQCSSFLNHHLCII